MIKRPHFFKFRTLALIILMIVALPLISGCQEKKKAVDPTAGRPVMRILFVGNDFTFMNNMYYMVQAFADSDPNAHFKIEVGLHAMQDASLSQIWNNPATKDVLVSKKWDYVIVQPHYMWASSDGSVYLTRKALSVWTSQITAIGAQPVLFMTWPMEASHSAYSDPKYTNLKNYKNTHRLIRGYSKALADKYGMLLVPIGDYWMYAINEEPGINLYNPDRVTPTLDASYLTALVIYKQLVDNTLDDIGYIPEGMTPETKATLISIASKKIQN
tara:strand:+ start:25033 stop:25848 length:816 start_codon:yes stop_codon:yes gene_type:complete